MKNLKFTVYIHQICGDLIAYTTNMTQYGYPLIDTQEVELEVDELSVDEVRLQKVAALKQKAARIESEATREAQKLLGEANDIEVSLTSDVA